MTRSLTIGLVALMSAAPAGAADPPLLSAKELAAAKKLNAVKCVKCHEDYSPKRYAEGDWAQWMVKMNRKARLTPAQADLLQRYGEVRRAEK